MIVECYSADVYCDLENHPYGTPGYMSAPDTFTGTSRRVTDRRRRKSGWIRIGGKDVCPACAKRLKEAREAKRC
jgi:hypothetical protein